MFVWFHKQVSPKHCTFWIRPVTSFAGLRQGIILPYNHLISVNMYDDLARNRFAPSQISHSPTIEMKNELFAV